MESVNDSDTKGENIIHTIALDSAQRMQLQGALFCRGGLVEQRRGAFGTSWSISHSLTPATLFCSRGHRSAPLGAALAPSPTPI